MTRRRVYRRKSKYSKRKTSSRRRRSYRRRYSRRRSYSRRRYSRSRSAYRRRCGKRDMSTCRYVTDVYGNQRGVCYKPCLSRKGKAYSAPVYTRKSVMDKYLERANAFQAKSAPGSASLAYSVVPSKSQAKPLSIWQPSTL